MRPVGSKYLLEEVLGRGATGTVWRGQVRDSGDRVAIKVLKEELAADPDVVMRFLRERSVLLRLSHPNIVRVRDLVVEGELLALVMDLVDSPDLHRYLQAHGRFSPVAGAMVMAQIADALASSHADGVVHRDLKPANVLLEERRGSDGRTMMRPMLTDFGIARLADSPGVTHTSEFVGTPAYVAPESAEGRPQTSAVDVYGAGIVLYELVAGQPPFRAESALGVLRQHMDAEPERPSALPEPLWTIIRHCLDKEPTRRPSAANLARALRTAAAGIGVHATPEQITAAEGVAALLVPDTAPAPAHAPGEHPAAEPTDPNAMRTDVLPTGSAAPASEQGTAVLPTGAPGSEDGTAVLPTGAAGSEDGTAVLPTGRGGPGQGGPNPGGGPDGTAVLPTGSGPGDPAQQGQQGPHPWESQLRAARDRNEPTRVAPALPPDQRPQRAPMPQEYGQQPQQQPRQPRYRPQQAPAPQQPPQYQQYQPQQQPYPPQPAPQPQRPPARAPQRRAEPEPAAAREPRPRPEPRQRRPRQPMRIPGLGCMKGCLFMLVILVVLAILVWNFTPVPDWVAKGESWWQMISNWFDRTGDWISKLTG